MSAVRGEQTADQVPVIEATNITKTFNPRGGGVVDKGVVHALRGVDFILRRGDAASFIGESGCGKTTLGRILAGLETCGGGDLRLAGQDVTRVHGVARRRMFQRVQLIHQDPYSALNPTSTIEETLRVPLKMRARQRGERRPGPWVRGRMLELLDLVGLDPLGVLDKYPHKLSGGQRQRVCIARALIPEPDVLVADEAVSMIDVSLRLGILNVFKKLRSEVGVALLFITHDVATARYIGPDGTISVIYRGLVVEQGPTDKIIQRPEHPYTQCLLSALPVMRGVETDGPDRQLPTAGPETHQRTDGDHECPFLRRCPVAQDACAAGVPPLVSVAGQPSAAHLHRCRFPRARSVIPQPLGPP